MNVLLVWVKGNLAVVLKRSECVADQDLVLAWLRNNGHRDTMLNHCKWSGSPVTELSLAQIKHPPIEG